MTKVERIGIFAVAVVLVVGVFAIFKLAEKTNECDELGGQMLKTMGGYVCFEIKRIK